MKKLMRVIVLAWGCALCAVVYADTVTAGDDFNRLAVGAMASYHNTASSEIGDVDANFDTVPVIGLTGTYFIKQWLSVDLSTQYIKTDLSVEYDDKSGKLGELKQTPVFLTARYQHKLDKINANIYLGIGANYFRNEFSQESGTDLSDFFGLNVLADINDSFGWHANVGTEYFFKKRYSVYLDLKVIFNQAEFDLAYPDSTRETRDVALNASALGIGFNYYFF